MPRIKSFLRGDFDKIIAFSSRIVALESRSGCVAYLWRRYLKFKNPIMNHEITLNGVLVFIVDLNHVLAPTLNHIKTHQNVSTHNESAPFPDNPVVKGFLVGDGDGGRRS